MRKSRSKEQGARSKSKSKSKSKVKTQEDEDEGEGEDEDEDEDEEEEEQEQEQEHEHEQGARAGAGAPARRTKPNPPCPAAGTIENAPTKESSASIPADTHRASDESWGICCLRIIQLCPVRAPTPAEIHLGMRPPPVTLLNVTECFPRAVCVSVLLV